MPEPDFNKGYSEETRRSNNRAINIAAETLNTLLGLAEMYVNPFKKVSLIGSYLISSFFIV